MQNSIELLTNSGLLIRIDGISLLTDPYSLAPGSPYRSSPESLLEEIIDGKGRFKRIDILLVTHDHPDHFDHEFGHAFLSAHPETLLIAPSTVVRGLRGARSEAIANPMIPLEKPPGGVKNIRVGGLEIQAIRTIHMGSAELQQSEHFSYYISGSSSIAILGDAKQDRNNFPVKKERTDLVAAPYLYATVKRGIRVIKDIFHPEQIVFVHMPDPDGAEADLVRIARQRAEELCAKGDHAYIMEDPGQTLFFL